MFHRELLETRISHRSLDLWLKVSDFKNYKTSSKEIQVIGDNNIDMAINGFSVEDKNENYIGQYFKWYLKQNGIIRDVFARRLGFNYSSNKRMMSAYLVKKDRLWKKSEIENWCAVLKIREDSTIYQKLMERAGRVDIGFGK